MELIVPLLPFSTLLRLLRIYPSPFSSMLRYMQTVISSFFPLEPVFPVQIAGMPDQPIENVEQLEAHLQSSYYLFTYRDSFEPIQAVTSAVYSDQGWGCLVRTSQMLLAHFLLRYGREEDRHLRLFFDSSSDTAPFSVHNMVRSVWDRKAFRAEYWSPSQGCEALRRTVERAVSAGTIATQVQVVCSTSGCLFAEDVVHAIRSGTEVVLIVTPVRVSAAQQLTQETYLALERLMEQPACLGMVGGIPGRSYYFFAHNQTQLLYLDPHCLVQPALVSDSPDKTGVVKPMKDSVHCVDWSHVDTSLFLAFAVRGMEEWGELRQHLPAKFLHVEERRSMSDYTSQPQYVRAPKKAYISPLNPAATKVRGLPRPRPPPHPSTSSQRVSETATTDVDPQSGEVVKRTVTTSHTIRSEDRSGSESWEALSDF